MGRFARFQEWRRNRHLRVVRVQSSPTTVASLRAELTERWDVPPEYRAYLGDQVLDEDYVIQAGDNIHWRVAP